MSLCVALTGGIASGKSRVAEEFIALGVPVIDADQVARDVVEPGTPGLAEVIEHFGSDITGPDRRLDRRRLRQIVFADPDQRRALEAILHPRIRAALKRWRDALTAPYGILMVPILAEGGFQSLADRILVVDVPRETQKQRLMARDGIDETLAEQMLAAQSSRDERLALADDVIDNSGPPEGLRARVGELHERYRRLAAQSG